MSRALSAKLIELDSGYSRPIKYLVLTAKTLLAIRRARPRVVFAQNPSIVLAFIVVLFQRVLSYRAVVDEHSAGLEPLEGRSKVLNAIAAWIIRNAQTVIVTNDEMSEFCRLRGGRPVVVFDPIPDISPGGPSASPGAHSAEKHLLFICSWSEDEPVEEFLQAVALAEAEGKFRIAVSVTGKVKAHRLPSAVPKCVTLAGFVSEERYSELLVSCDAVVVLTKREGCLNCGAYEAIGAGKPGLLSNKRVLRSLFRQGFLFVENDPKSIARGLCELTSKLPELNRGVTYLRSELSEKNDRQLAHLKQELGIE